MMLLAYITFDVNGLSEAYDVIGPSSI